MRAAEADDQDEARQHAVPKIDRRDLPDNGLVDVSVQSDRFAKNDTEQTKDQQSSDRRTARVRSSMTASRTFLRNRSGRPGLEFNHVAGRSYYWSTCRGTCFYRNEPGYSWIASNRSFCAGASLPASESGTPACRNTPVIGCNDTSVRHFLTVFADQHLQRQVEGKLQRRRQHDRRAALGVAV